MAKANRKATLIRHARIEGLGWRRGFIVTAKNNRAKPHSTHLNGEEHPIPAGSLYAMAAEIVFMSITSSRSRQAPFHFGFFPEDRPPRKGLGRSLLTAAVAEPNVLPCRETAGRMNLNAHRDSLPNCGTKHLLADQPIATGWVEPTVNEIIARPGLCPLVLVPIMGAPGPSHLGTWDVYAGCPRSRGPQRQVLVAGVRIRF